jgi:ABC-type antimicrobial peptide transport system permease subunit
MAAILCAGMIVGFSGAATAGRVLTSIVYLANPDDPVVVGGAILVMVSVGTVASWFPTMQSLKTQPVIALRSE